LPFDLICASAYEQEGAGRFIDFQTDFLMHYAHHAKLIKVSNAVLVIILHLLQMLETTL
jgi:hypothetical protein